MTTTFFLVRHAVHDRVGTVQCGRMPGVSLGAVGREQARRLAQRFANENVASVQSSALERARETAEPIAACLERPVEINEGLMEIEFGAWTGRSFSEFGEDPLWAAWNGARSVARPPNGESMLEVQARIVGAIDGLRRAYREKAVVLVSHGDVIKAALLYYLGLPIDAHSRFDVDTASISSLAVGDWGSKILRLNEGAAA